MAISTKYGKINIEKIGDDEPVFILRAQDRLAEPAIQMYKALASSHGLPLVNGVERALEEFITWGGKRKMPD